MQLHAVGRARGEHRVERTRGEFVPADDAECAQAQQSPRRRGGAQMVGVGAAESEEGVVPLSVRRTQIRGEFAPLVARYLRVDQVIPFEEESDVSGGEAGLDHLLERGGEPRGEGLGVLGHDSSLAGGAAAGGAAARPLDVRARSAT